ARGVAETGGYRWLRAAADVEEALERGRAGDHDEAITAGARALREGREAGSSALTAAALGALATVHESRGAGARAEDLAHEAAALWKSLGARPAAAEALRVQAAAALRRGEIPRAARFLGLAAETAEAVGRPLGILAVRTTSARMEVRRGDAARAEAEIGRGRAATAGLAELPPALAGEADAVHALARRLARDPEGAEARFRAASDALDRAGARPAWASASAAYAQALLDEGQEPPPPVWRRARDLCARALEVFEACRMERDAVRVRLLLSECEGRLPPPGPAAPPTEAGLEGLLAEIEAAARELEAAGAAVASGGAPSGAGERLAGLERKVEERLRALQAERDKFAAEAADLAAERQALATLQRVSRTISSELDSKKLLTLIMDMAVEVTRAERGFLMLRDDQGNFRFSAARNLDRDTIQKPEFKVSFSIAREVIQTGEPVLTTDALEDERYRDRMSVQDLKLKSVACVALRARNRAIGAVYVDNRFVAGLFTPKDLAFLQAFANQAAAALENARLYEENVRALKALEESKKAVDALNLELSRKVETQGVELAEARTELERERAEQTLRYRYDSIVGRSPKMREMLRLLDRVTDSTVPVLIQGESGTGKELVARAIHFNGPRRAKAFAAENCSAIAESLLESELFGHVKGAFTGADRDRKGLFEVASGGTLFLDELGDMSPEMQKKLLRVLQEGELRRVGGKETVRVDVRIIAASNRDLRKLKDEGKFREDLFYRLNVITVEMPPLRERREDIPLLVAHFLERHAHETGGKPREISPEALGALQGYDWPGNVRELENEIRKAATLSTGKIGLEWITPRVRDGAGAGGAPAPGTPKTIRQAVEALERRMIAETLQATGGNKSRAAEILGLSRYGLHHKILRYGLAGAAKPEPEDADEPPPEETPEEEGEERG
ncbi:MAG: sigma-54-dependent Fis family transcriptional regulator, partial [Planctomycetales bacterium]|nr:sigma-54-dependent Fis family transcriptional regulator [Planctomycetales bacterium]